MSAMTEQAARDLYDLAAENATLRARLAEAEKKNGRVVADLVRAVTERDDTLSDLAAAQAEVARLQAFKSWVHAYLDSHGVPHHPPGTHGAEGCRIGDRLDWLLRRAAEAGEESDG